MSLVEVKPVERERWYRNKEADVLVQPMKFQCAVDPSTRKYSFPASKEELKLIEEALGIKVDLTFNPNKNNDLFDDEMSHVKLIHGSNFFDNENPYDLIKLIVLKGNNLIANSLEDYEMGRFPKAKFVIFDEVSETEAKASKQAKRREAIVKMDSLSKDQKVNFVLLMTGKNVSSQSNVIIDKTLEDAITITGGVEKFLELLSAKKEDINIEAFIIRLVQSRVLTRRGTSIEYGDLVLGIDMPNAISYLKDPKNAVLKNQLMDKLEK